MALARPLALHLLVGDGAHVNANLGKLCSCGYRSENGGTANGVVSWGTAAVFHLEYMGGTLGKGRGAGGQPGFKI